MYLLSLSPGVYRLTGVSPALPVFLSLNRTRGPEQPCTATATANDTAAVGARTHKMKTVVIAEATASPPLTSRSAATLSAQNYAGLFCLSCLS